VTAHSSLVPAPESSDAAVALPELAVAPHVYVLPLPATQQPDLVVEQWLALDAELTGELATHHAELAGIVAAACAEAQVGEVALFLSYRSGGPAGRLTGGAALLTLELLEPLAGHPDARAAALAVDLGLAADRMGHGDGLADVGTRRTASGVPAVRLRFLALVGAPVDAEVDASVDSLAGAWAGAPATPMVEACRWLYPVPGHPDLAWSLVFQTTDIAEADELVAEFDQLAGSLAWVGS
jgi:hypothetical protein